MKLSKEDYEVIREDVEVKFAKLLGDDVSLEWITNAIDLACEDLIETLGLANGGEYTSEDVSVAVRRVLVTGLLKL